MVRWNPKPWQVDRPDNNGVMPLMSVVPTRDVKMLRTLLAHRADANIILTLNPKP